LSQARSWEVRDDECIGQAHVPGTQL
jgi:hypothetical protein